MAKPDAKRSKRKRETEQEIEEDALARSLAAYGERFLSMFDDAEHRAASAPKQQEEDSGSEENGSSGSGREDGSSSSDDGGGSDDDEAVPAAFVEHIFDSGGIRARRASAAGSGANSARGGGPAGGAGGLPATPQQQLGSAADELRMRIERKRFMSSKAAVITKSRSTFSPSQQKAPQRRRQPGGGTPGAPGAAGGEGDGSVSREEFRSMQREVQLYGASALDKKSKKAFEADQLARVGAKAAARPRVPANIGYGMAKKAAQREERALQEGIAAGMIQQKGLGKKKRREKEQARKADRGLMEDGGAFRPGILRVRAPPAGSKVSSKGGGKGGRRK